MPTLPDVRLETYFSRWEFAARHHLTASDAETLTLTELLDLADDGRARWGALDLGHTQAFGLPALREEIAGTYERLDAGDVLCFAGAEEGLCLAMQALLEPGDHAVVITPNYQAAETVPLSICGPEGVTGVPLREADGWALDVDAVAAALRRQTKLVSVTVPSNPTAALPDEPAPARLRDAPGMSARSSAEPVQASRDPDQMRALTPGQPLGGVRGVRARVTGREATGRPRGRGTGREGDGPTGSPG